MEKKINQFYPVVTGKEKVFFPLSVGIKKLRGTVGNSMDRPVESFIQESKKCVVQWNFSCEEKDL